MNQMRGSRDAQGPYNIAQALGCIGANLCEELVVYGLRVTSGGVSVVCDTQKIIHTTEAVKVVYRRSPTCSQCVRWCEEPLVARRRGER